MRSTQRRHGLILDLDYAFKSTKIVKAWKATVRNGLRKQHLHDLHDFLDIHRNIQPFADRLRQDILNGHYKPSAPEFVLLEKRDGIPRRLAVPDPADAIALQCIVEVLEVELKKAQPSTNAYYSRTHMPGDIDQVDGTFAYPWWILWPQFQKRIWKFTQSYQYIVVTDIANYFDSIPLPSLRNTLASCGRFSENLLNFLFFLLETLSWRPYYMPHSGVGLPQINFDAPRLLAHAYLFNVDKELDAATNGNFVRWMDDMDAGVNTREEGKKLLRNLDNVLGSQGLRLNTSKSKILFAAEAVTHFWIQENRALTIIENSIRYGPATQAIQKKRCLLLRKRFRVFNRKPRAGQWEKVLKRFLNLFGLLRDSYLEKHIQLILDDIPGLRPAALNYFLRLGITEKRFSTIEKFLLSGHCEDDVSLLEAVQCLISWETPATGKIVKRMTLLARRISQKSGTYVSSGVIAALWLLAKYGTRADLMSLIASSKDVWGKSSWTARQVASVTPLLEEQDRQSISEIVTRNGLLQALEVMAHIASLKRQKTLDRQLSSYLMHKPSPNYRYYPLPKIVISIALLRGGMNLIDKNKLRSGLKLLIADRRYCYLINRY